MCLMATSNPPWTFRTSRAIIHSIFALIDEIEK
jgi:hypothetical protein